MPDSLVNKKIKFNFHPSDFENSNHTIEKSEGGRQRKYLIGVSSGLDVDAHGERMTDKCIKSFMDQANSGDLHLYVDIHGIRSTEDIGIMTKAEILPNGDWYTEYRLYDEEDGIGSHKLETIDTVWKQMNGLPPYTKPKQKGFSVEGILTDEAVLYDGAEANRGVLDSVDLDGVVLVPRPAYNSSIATSVFKALGEVSPEREASLVNSLQKSLEREDLSESFFKDRWKIQDALECTIDKIMIKKSGNEERELEIVFKEYADTMKKLIMKSSETFVKGQTSQEETVIYKDSPKVGGDPRMDAYKTIAKNLRQLAKSMEKRNGKTKPNNT